MWLDARPRTEKPTLLGLRDNRIPNQKAAGKRKGLKPAEKNTLVLSPGLFLLKHLCGQAPNPFAEKGVYPPQKGAIAPKSGKNEV